jgi:hypothetical protein
MNISYLRKFGFSCIRTILSTAAYIDGFEGLERRIREGGGGGVRADKNYTQEFVL